MIKKGALLSILLFLIALFPINAENIVQNGGFEQTHNDLPIFWSTDAWQNNASITRYSMGSDNPKSGTYYAVIENLTRNDARFIQQIPVEPEMHYRISCWIRVAAEGSSRVAANIGVIEPGFNERSEYLSNTKGEWLPLTFTVRTGKNQTEMTVCARLGFFGNDISGKADFDDFIVEKIGKKVSGPVAYLGGTPNSKGAKENKGLMILLIILGILAGAGIISFLIIFFIIKPGKIGLASGKAEKVPALAKKLETTSFTKKDFIVMGALTLVYTIIAFTHLGSFVAPKTHWWPAVKGESFYVDFGEVKNIKRVFYFEGLPNGHVKGKFTLEYSTNAEEWKTMMTIVPASVFYWYHSGTNVDARYVKVTAEVPHAQLKEMGFYGGNMEHPYEIKQIFSPMKSFLTKGSPSNVFDEQDTIPERPSMMNGMPTSFDELYHARTAYEHIVKVQHYETTHPPMGKNIIALGILFWGMNPFGWRFMGTTFGVIMVIIMYMFGKQLFKKTEYAFMCAFLMSFDFMHFVHTRIATIDSFATTFIILMYFFMYKYYSMDFYKVEFKKTLVPLLFSGLFWGIGFSTKWLVAFAGPGLALLFFVTLGRRIYDYVSYKKRLGSKSFLKGTELKARIISFQKRFKMHIGLTLAWCVLVFIVLPLIIYVLSYIPIMQVPNARHDLNYVLKEQKGMFNYHSGMESHHPSETRWFEWPFMIQSMRYHVGQGLPADKSEGVVALGNPAIWWICSFATWGLAALAMAVFIKRIKKNRGLVLEPKDPTSRLGYYFSDISKGERLRFFILIAYASNYLMWAISPRQLTFIYHYFQSVPFIILAMVYLIKEFKEHLVKKDKKIQLLGNGTIYFYLAIVLILFILFYPVLAGQIVDKSYIKLLKWLPNWQIY